MARRPFEDQGPLTGGDGLSSGSALEALMAYLDSER